MTECDYNHLFLYAKGHYAHSASMVEDVRTILAHRAAVDRISISDGVILENLMEVIRSHGLAYKILANIFFWTTHVSMGRLVELTLAEMSGVRVLRSDGERVLNIGRPDPAILPLKDTE